MVITVQGYNGKKNKSLEAAAVIAGMNAMKRNSKTLVVQLINNDMYTAEYILGGFKQETSLISDGQRTLTEDGIDALLRDVDAKKLMKDDFDNNCTQILTAENLLDVTAISGSDTFTHILLDRLEALKNLIDNASDVYDTIILLLPSNNEEIIKTINEMAYEDNAEDNENKENANKKRVVDKSIYCIKQGFMKNAAVYGENICYLCMDFESDSIFTYKELKRVFVKKRERLYTIAHNVAANDAVMRGNLANYIRKNRELTELDGTYEWIYNVCALLSWIAGEAVEESNSEWEKVVKEPKVLRGDESLNANAGEQAILTEEELQQATESVDEAVEEIGKDVAEVIGELFPQEEVSETEEENAEKPQEASALDDFFEDEDSVEEPEVYSEEELYVTPEEIESVIEHDGVYIKDGEMVSPDKFFEEKSEETEPAADETETENANKETEVADETAEAVTTDTEPIINTEEVKKKKGLFSIFKKKELNPKDYETQRAGETTILDNEEAKEDVVETEDSVGALLDEMFKEENNTAVGEPEVEADKEESEEQEEVATEEIPQTVKAEPAPKKVWTCSCGTENFGGFCSECGTKKPLEGWVCKNCGTVNNGKFCFECGAKKPIEEWTCKGCGTVNKGKFCFECGMSVVENEA